MIDEPTRVTERSRTQIDLVFSNRPEIIIKSGVHHIGISDHTLLISGSHFNSKSGVK